MSEPLFPLDLKFLPDWLKESPKPNPYAGHPGDSGGHSEGGRGGRGARPGGSGRGPQPRGPHSQGQGERRFGGGPGPGRDGQRDSRGQRGARPERGPRDGRMDRQHRHGAESGGPRPSQDNKLPAEIRIDFLPEPNAAAHIARQIRQSAKTYPLFGTARMFLEKPERHIARITSKDPVHPLHQLADGPIGFDAALLERDAFRNLWDKFYKEEVLTTDPPKGNFTSVARCRSTGQFLGPTSHHAYQVAVRRLYEERFSRFMSFLEFQRQEVEVVTSEQAVEDWKAQASRSTVYKTLDEADPQQFKSLAEAEVHFRKHHLPGLMKSGPVLECSGRAVRELHERALTRSAREAFDKELAYPSGIVNGLRNFFNEEGLQVFKHRKRVLYVSAVRPKRADPGTDFAEGPATLLKIIEEFPRIFKRDLALRVLGPLETPPDAEGKTTESPELTARKTQLAADLHYLVHTGYVLEFSDGRLDLPLSPKQQAAVDSAKADPEEEEFPEERASADSTAAALPPVPESDPVQQGAPESEPASGQASPPEATAS
jgi:hypothetical protein